MEPEKTRKFIDWRPSDKGDTIGWALLFIWAAFLMMTPLLNFGKDWNGWGLFFIGLGVIGLAGALIRLLVRNYPNPSLWDFIFGFSFFSWDWEMRRAGSGRLP